MFQDENKLDGLLDEPKEARAKPKRRKRKAKLLSLFRSRKRWCRFHLAENAMGGEVEVSSKTAVSFCLLGAIQHEYPEGRWEELERKLARHIWHKEFHMAEMLDDEEATDIITEFNDENEIEDVRRVLRATRI